jgi:hypothetical protein
MKLHSHGLPLVTGIFFWAHPANIKICVTNSVEFANFDLDWNSAKDHQLGSRMKNTTRLPLSGSGHAGNRKKIS